MTRSSRTDGHRPIPTVLVAQTDCLSFVGWRTRIKVYRGTSGYRGYNIELKGMNNHRNEERRKTRRDQEQPEKPTMMLIIRNYRYLSLYIHARPTVLAPCSAYQSGDNQSRPKVGGRVKLTASRYHRAAALRSLLHPLPFARQNASSS